MTNQMTEQRQKIRDLPPTAVRLAPELRHALMREATINGRSLHGEIVRRLQQSLLQPSEGYTVAEPAPEWAPTYREAEATLNSAEQWLVQVFRELPPDKQLALLSLLKK